ncbi:MAG: hypothetical protein FWD73_11375 [Polyangiaceae bacterium]|nr:hypothetical protein [Polyangiaceae bacterium]
MVKTTKVLSIATVLGAAFAASADARAQSVIRNPNDHPKYSVEVEPHGVLGWADLYTSSGFGLGGRFSIPIVDPGFIPTINNNVAISFGIDWVHYTGCYYAGTHCGADYFMFPVALQWNFWLTKQWSVFGEPGLFIYHGFYNNDFCNGLVGCSNPTVTSIDPAFFVGARYHFNNRTALTMRVGYPYLSIGVSFFP